MFVNNRTLITVKKVICRIDNATDTVISNSGYVITEPICTPCVAEEYPEKGVLYTNVTNCTLSDNFESKGISLKMNLITLFLVFILHNVSLNYSEYNLSTKL